MLLPLFLIERFFQPVINFTPEVIISIFYTGIFASITAFFLWNRSVEIIGAPKAGIIYYTLRFSALYGHFSSWGKSFSLFTSSAWPL
jgi:drug/metabolite transporter (DMT)-like permease